MTRASARHPGRLEGSRRALPRWLLSLPALAALALAQPAAGQISEREAVAQVKASARASLTLFKQTGKTALAALDAALDVVEAQLGPASDPSAVLMQFAGAANQFVIAMNDAYADAVTRDVVAALSLDQLAAGGDLMGLYPADLLYGTNGVLDGHRTRLRQAAEKIRSKALKRLAKTAARAEKVAASGWPSTCASRRRTWRARSTRTTS